MAGGEVVCRCGCRTPIVLRPLFLVVGPSGTGKSTLSLRLPAAVPEVVVLDGDVLWGLVSPDQFRSAWVRVAANLAQGDRPVLLLSSFTGEDLADHPRRALLGPIHTLALVCDDDVLAARLRARPAWRGVDEGFIATMRSWNGHLRAQQRFPVVDTSALDVDQTVEALRTWVIGHLALP